MAIVERHSTWTRYRWFPWAEWRIGVASVNGTVYLDSWIERRWRVKP